MGHASIIAELKSMMKEPITAQDPAEHNQQLKNESDRSTIILHGGLIEEMLVSRLGRLMPDINGDERARIFHFEGPLGSFSNRIRMSHALGIIDRPTKRKIEILKELRNVAAHCHKPMSFDLPQVRGAIAQLFHKGAEVFDDEKGSEIRTLYSVACNSLAYVIMHPDSKFHWHNLWDRYLEQKDAKPETSPEKS